LFHYISFNVDTLHVDSTTDVIYNKAQGGSMSLTMPGKDQSVPEVITHNADMQDKKVPSSEDLVTPEEAASIMSNRAGYEITPDDIRQMRRHNRLKAARQMRRTTLYERSEIENATPPKKRHPKKLKSEDKVTDLDPNPTNRQKTQIASSDNELALCVEAQIVKLEKQRLALEEKRLEMNLILLEIAQKMVEVLDSNADTATRSAIAQSLPPIISHLTSIEEPKVTSSERQNSESRNVEEEAEQEHLRQYPTNTLSHYPKQSTKLS
jgi:hypothetical protein